MRLDTVWLFELCTASTFLIVQRKNYSRKILSWKGDEISSRDRFRNNNCYSGTGTIATSFFFCICIQNKKATWDYSLENYVHM